MRHTRPRYISDPTYIFDWMKASANYTSAQPVAIEPPSRHWLARYGPPRCTICWDTGLCPDCYGRTPQYCSAGCSTGTCTCAAGAARRAHMFKWVDM